MYVKRGPLIRAPLTARIDAAMPQIFRPSDVLLIKLVLLVPLGFILL